ncbi:unnamed protein product [Protopolystoma xenopodis]|uniref:Uncharacterized protein n=1 Tax=Protopolystoma xenopodis TaxID=117903 RepID=A0A448XFG3_9PLAT|nr:unnamed protein product [Protopolystoma xenopodis]
MVAEIPPGLIHDGDLLSSNIKCLADSSILADETLAEVERERVSSLFLTFEVFRNSEWNHYISNSNRRDVEMTVKQKLRTILDNEERLEFFQHAKEIQKAAWLAPRSRSERNWSRLKEWREDITEYNRKKQRRDVS